MANAEVNDEHSGLDEQDSAYQLIAQQALVYAQDLKEVLHQSRETRVALERLRHTFLGVVNHEMRTPLVLVLQVLEILEDGRLGPLTTEQSDALLVLKRQTEILSHMIDSLTRVASFLSKQASVKPVMAELEPVFDNVIPLTEFQARSKEITIETNLASDLPAFPLDVKQMTEALTQLLDNAIKFNRPGGKIRVSAQADSHWVILAVSDTGIGIEAERLSAIWEIFEQSADPLRRTQEGLGLGLALTRYIVEAHGGTIEVETTPGYGSTFILKLPVQEAT
jgi:two-component system phosphate regulon sensor histidine kinase PhoR